MGSTTTFGTGYYTFGTGYYTFTLPVSTGGSLPQFAPLGNASAYDVSGASVYTRKVTLQASTTVALRDDAGNALTNAVPATWASTDRISIQGCYEIA